MRREFGGCAGNIAYNLHLLGGKPLPMATVGADFAPYRAHFSDLGIPLTHVKEIADLYTAQAFITTDLDDNQITAFHPGAMERSKDIPVPRDRGLNIGLVGPDGRDSMILHSQQLADAGVPFIFDPGQAMPLFGGQDLEQFIDLATWVVVNDYEGQLVQERTGLTPEQIAGRCQAYIVTRGGDGSLVHTRDGVTEIPPVKAACIADPTGCGDSYRAALIAGLQAGRDWATTGRMASLIGAIKIAHRGTQTHHFTPEEFADRFRTAFGYDYR
jgi:adenosine kinase